MNISGLFVDVRPEFNNINVTLIDVHHSVNLKKIIRYL